MSGVWSRQLNETIRAFNGCGEALKGAKEKPMFHCSVLEKLGLMWRLGLNVRRCDFLNSIAGDKAYVECLWIKLSTSSRSRAAVEKENARMAETLVIGAN